MRKLAIFLLTLVSSASSMAREIPFFNPAIGTEQYREIVSLGYSVDKTMLIQSIIDEPKKVLLITRPRRWGKSVALDMLRCFFEKSADSEKNKHLFKSRKIAQATSRLFESKEEVSTLEHFQGRYPVVSVSFKGVQGKTIEEMHLSFAMALSLEFKRHLYLIDWLEEISKSSSASFEARANALSELKQFQNFAFDRGKDASTADLKDSVRFLTELLHRYHGKAAYVLVDEYDTPIYQAYKEGYFKDSVKFFHDLFHNCFKGNPHFKRAVITGILRISRVDLFSGLNNFSEDNVLIGKYGSHYGFTESEMDLLLQQTRVENKTIVKNWYNGYSIGDEIIYNPWSIVHYLDSRKLDGYWLASGNAPWVGREMLLDDIQGELALLRSGKSLEKTFKKNLEFLDLNTDSSAIWPLLTYAGYLTAQDCIPMGDDYRCQLRIPNEEILSGFSSFLRSVLISKNLPVVFSEAWNFNPIHLAALTGDPKIFEPVRNEYKNFLDTKSREDLGVADFADLAKTTFKELEGYESLQVPSVFEHACLVQKLFTLANMYHWVLHRILDGTVGGMASLSTEYFLDNYCDRYQKYESIDIRKPRTLASIKQFKKYALLNPGSYVSLNSTCHLDYELLSEFSSSALNDVSYLLPKNTTFTLCHPKPRSTHKDL